VSETTSNAYEFSVSELAQSLKRLVEDQFGHVRVRGELGRVTIAKSGHCYLDIKDDKAVINSIIWKGTMNRLAMRPEEGMDVIVEGRMSTYPGRSNYQLIIEKMELAGEGALMALFEKRKKALAAEGLFETERKKDLPFMPTVIGVVTSPTGAVIRDILHRIMDRFPVHVLVWPVLRKGLFVASRRLSKWFPEASHASDAPSSQNQAYRGKWRDAQYERAEQAKQTRHKQARRPKPPPRPPERGKCLATLGLKEPVHLMEIKTAYRQMAKVYHPDRFASEQHSDADRQAAAAKMRDVNAAYDWLRANA